MLGHSVFRPILPIFTRHLGASALQIGLLTSGFMIARAFTSAAGGYIIDRGISSRLLIRIGVGIAAILILGFYFSNYYITVLMVRIAQGVCSGLIWPSAQIMVGEYSDPNIRARALSLYQIVGRVGMIASRGLLAIILLIGFNLGFSEMGGFRLTFLVGSFILGLGFVQTLTITERPEVHIDQKKAIHFHPIFILTFIIGGLMAMQSITILYFNEMFQLKPVMIVTILLIIDIALLITTYFISYLADRVGIQPALFIIIVPCVAAASALPLMKNIIPFVLLWFIIRITISAFIPVARSYATKLPTGIGSNIGFLNMATNLGSAIGPIVAGFLYDRLTGGLKISGYSILALFLIPYLIVKIVKKV